MDEDIEFQPAHETSPAEENTTPVSTDIQPDADAAGDRVFDISSDLNISQLKEEQASSIPHTLPSTQAPEIKISASPKFTAAQTAVDLQPKKKIEPEKNPEPSINQLHQPARPIPMQDFSDSLTRARHAATQTPAGDATQNPSGPDHTAPANPPTKTLGSIQTKSQRPGISVPPTPISNLKAIRTFEGDVAEVMSHTHTSTASIAIAESSKGSTEKKIVTREAPTHAFRNSLLAVLSVVLIGGGAYAAYYLYTISPLGISRSGVTPAPKTQIRTAIVKADTQAVMPIDSLGRAMIIAKIKAELAKSQANSSIKEIIPVRTTGGTVGVTATDMIKVMNIDAPDILVRSLGPNWMLGTYADQSGSRNLFVVTTTTFFQNTFAGMLQWENVMPDDLKDFLYTTSPTDIGNIQAAAPSIQVRGAATTSTTQAAAGTNTIPKGIFVDRIISNRDVREFITSDGHMLFLYSFIDNGTLLMTSNEATLTAILTRLENQSFVR